MSRAVGALAISGTSTRALAGRTPRHDAIERSVVREGRLPAAPLPRDLLGDRAPDSPLTLNSSVFSSSSVRAVTSLGRPIGTVGCHTSQSRVLSGGRRRSAPYRGSKTPSMDEARRRGPKAQGRLQRRGARLSPPSRLSVRSVWTFGEFKVKTSSTCRSCCRGCVALRCVSRKGPGEYVARFCRRHGGERAGQRRALDERPAKSRASELPRCSCHALRSTWRSTPTFSPSRRGNAGAFACAPMLVVSTGRDVSTASAESARDGEDRARAIDAIVADAFALMRSPPAAQGIEAAHVIVAVTPDGTSIARGNVVPGRLAALVDLADVLEAIGDLAETSVRRRQPTFVPWCPAHLDFFGGRAA